jgi:hypothetical protein
MRRGGKALVALLVVGGVVGAGLGWRAYATPRVAVSGVSMRTVPQWRVASDPSGDPAIQVGSGVTMVYVRLRNVGHVSVRIEFPSNPADTVRNGLLGAEPTVLRLGPGASREVALRYKYHCAASSAAAADGASVTSDGFTLTATAPLRERHLDLPLPLPLYAMHEKGCTP